ncbi:hypothetical protein SAMN04488120_12116, partial [Fontimonas thermophila]
MRVQQIGWRIQGFCRVEPPPRIPEAVWFESRCRGQRSLLPIVSRFGFCWRDVPDRPQQSAMVEP